MTEICSLSSSRCESCTKDTPPLSSVEIAVFSCKEIPKWILYGSIIFRELSFKNFQEALDFVVLIGSLSEAENHHPNIFLYQYKKVRFELTTHAIRGLSRNDFIVAAKIDVLFALSSEARGFASTILNPSISDDDVYARELEYSKDKFDTGGNYVSIAEAELREIETLGNFMNQYRPALAERMRRDMDPSSYHDTTF